MLSIGLLKELKSTEGRVMLTPEGVKVLTKNGVAVFVEQGVGETCRFSEIDYQMAGAGILPTMEKIMQKAELLLKVTPPQPIEFELLNQSHSVISFYNALNYKTERFNALLGTNATFISAELIQDEEGNYPLLNGMSEIAGHLAVGKVAQLLTVPEGGKGKLMSGTPLSKPAHVTIIGAGKVGRTAAQAALNSGAQVTLFGLKEKKIQNLQADFSEATVEFYSDERLQEKLPETDALIISVYSLKTNYDMKISREMISLMEEGSVVVDVSINQNSILETSHITNFEQPTYVINGIVHYCVPNISAAVPLTASRLITKKILPFLKILSKDDLKETLVQEPGILSALCMYRGKVTQRIFAERFGQKFYSIFELLELNL